MTMHLGVSELTALGIFASYFLIIAALFTLILWTRPKATAKDGPNVYLFQVLTLVSLGYTWYYMLKYIYGSFLKFHEHRYTLVEETTLEQVVRWLQGSELFEEAWAAACFGKVNWWWSQQICLYTAGAWLVFIWSHGKTYRIKHVWAYMLLGQLVAICVSSNLFYVAVLRAANQQEESEKSKASTSNGAPLTLVFACIAALGLTAYIPSTMYTTSFLPVLLLIHAVIFLPLIFLQKESKVHLMDRSVLYSIIGFMTLVLQLRTTLAVFGIPLIPTLQILNQISLTPWMSLYKEAVQILHSHPAQASIGWDVIWTGISLVAWNFFGLDSGSNWLQGIVSAIQLPISGVGVVAPMVFDKPALDTTEKLKAS